MSSIKKAHLLEGSSRNEADPAHIDGNKKY
jgi:hypothetical protein